MSYIKPSSITAFRVKACLRALLYISVSSILISQPTSHVPPFDFDSPVQQVHDSCHATFGDECIHPRYGLIAKQLTKLLYPRYLDKLGFLHFVKIRYVIFGQCWFWYSVDKR